MKNDTREYHLHSSGLYYPAVPTFLHKDELATKTGFASLYAVSKADAEAIQQAGTSKGFKGVVWSERLWMDFDSYEAGERAQGKLREMGYDYTVYDTGGRGLHIGVARVSYPSHLLPAQDKQWTAEHFPKTDPTIYTHLHLFRLPNTRHRSTGNIKKEVSINSGKCVYLSKLSNTSPSNEIISVDNHNTSVFNCSRVMTYSMPVESGDRHAQLVSLTYALKDDACVSKEFALMWVEQVNLAFKEPKDYGAVEHIVTSIYG